MMQMALSKDIEHASVSLMEAALLYRFAQSVLRVYFDTRCDLAYLYDLAGL